MGTSSSRPNDEALLHLYFTPEEIAALTPGEKRLLIALQSADLPELPGPDEPPLHDEGAARLLAALSAERVSAPPGGSPSRRRRTLRPLRQRAQRKQRPGEGTSASPSTNGRVPDNNSPPRRDKT